MTATAISQIGKKFTNGNTLYNVIADFNGKEIVVVEIPGQRSPIAWHASSKSDLISTTCATINQSNSGDWTFSTFTAKGLEDCFGDEIPKAALDIATQHGSVVQYNDKWLAPSDTDADEYKWAIDYLGHDIHTLRTLTNISDCIDFINNYTGHGCVYAESALVKVLLDQGMIEEDQDGDE